LHSPDGTPAPAPADEADVPSPAALATIGARLRALRLQAGWTQEALGQPFFSKGYISQVEHGRLAPSLALLSVASSRLGAPLERLAPELETVRCAEDAVRLWRVAERLRRHGEVGCEVDVLEQASRLAGASDDGHLRGEGLLRYADALRRQGRPGEALDACAEALESFSAAGATCRVGECYHAWALVHSERGDPDGALRDLRRALRRIPAQDVRHAKALLALARLLLEIVESDEALRCARQAVALCHARGEGGLEIEARLLAAEAQVAAGDVPGALDSLLRAEKIDAGGDRLATAAAIAALKAVARDDEPAMLESLAAAEAAADHTLAARLCTHLSARRLRTGDPAGAAGIAERGVRHATAARQWLREARLEGHLAVALATQGDAPGAVAACLVARDRLLALKRPQAAQSVLREVCRCAPEAAATLAPLLERAGG